MKKLIIFVSFILLFAVSLVGAVNLEVKKLSDHGVIINGLDNPAIFNVEIKNLGSGDDFQFYNLLGFSMAPKGVVHFNQNQEKEIPITIYPREDFNFKGFYNFQYTIRGSDGSEQKEKIIIKFVDLKDIFEVGSVEINPENNLIKIYIYNKESIDFEKVKAHFSSPFFDFEKEFSIDANEKKEFEIKLNRNDIKKLLAGFYTINAKISVGDLTESVDGKIRFVEKDLLTTTKNSEGIIVHKEIIKKVNEGNTISELDVSVQKNIISRLFTTISPQPDFVERKGTIVYYSWNRDLKPGDEVEIVVVTNWIFPLIILFLILIIVGLAKIYSSSSLSIRKKITFVHAKGGEFALKVTLNIRAKEYIEKVNVIDRLPPLVKLFDRFGAEKPSRVHEQSRRIEWNFPKLEQGEMRIVSYVIYSKIGIFGKFALPSATAIFERDGVIKETQSNRAFFVAEQKIKDESE